MYIEPVGFVPMFQAGLDQIEGNFSAAQEENANATRLLEEAQKYLDAANKALEVSPSHNALQFYPTMHCMPADCRKSKIW